MAASRHHCQDFPPIVLPRLFEESDRHTTRANEMQFVNPLNLELRQTGSYQLLPDFIHRIRRVKRRDEVTFQHRWSTFCMLLHELHGSVVIGRADKIDQHHRGAGFNATGCRAPKSDGIGKVMKQTVTDHRIEEPRLY